MRPNPFLQRIPRRKKPALKRALLFLLSIAACAATVAASQFLLGLFASAAALATQI